MKLLTFIFANIEWFLIGWLALTFIILAVKDIRKKKKPNDKQMAKMRAEYENSIFYKQTNIPFENVMEEGTASYAKYRVFKELEKIKLKHKSYFFDIDIPSTNSVGVHLDMVMVSSAGIFVFYPMALNHVVTGSITDDRWMAVVYGNKKIDEFEWIDNPLMHIKRSVDAIEHMNPMQLDCCSYVVHVGNAVFEVENPTKTHIVSVDDLRNAMKNDVEVEAITDDAFRFMNKVLGEYVNTQTEAIDDVISSDDLSFDDADVGEDT